MVRLQGEAKTGGSSAGGIGDEMSAIKIGARVPSTKIGFAVPNRTPTSQILPEAAAPKQEHLLTNYEPAAHSAALQNGSSTSL